MYYYRKTWRRGDEVICLKESNWKRYQFHRMTLGLLSVWNLFVNQTFSLYQRAVMCVRYRKRGRVWEKKTKPVFSLALRQQRWLKNLCWTHCYWKSWAHGHHSSFLPSFCPLILSLIFLSFHVYVCLWAFGQWWGIRMTRILFEPVSLWAHYTTALFISLLCFSHSDLIRWFISPANNACLFMRCHLKLFWILYCCKQEIRFSTAQEGRRAGALFFQTQT